MARTYVPPPQYVTTLQQGYNPGGIDGGAGYRAAVGDSYNQNYESLLTEAREGEAGSGLRSYDPQQAAIYAQQEQQRYQGGSAPNTKQLGQIAYDQAQRNNLQAVGAQRGGGGQAQGLRAAMMGTTQGAQQQTQAGMQAQQEQVQQRQAILQQRLAAEAQQSQAKNDWQKEEASFNKQREENDADTQAGIFDMAASAFSDARAKVKKAKRAKAPQLVIMLGGK